MCLTFSSRSSIELHLQALLWVLLGLASADRTNKTEEHFCTETAGQEVSGNVECVYIKLPREADKRLKY